MKHQPTSDEWTADSADWETMKASYDKARAEIDASAEDSDNHPVGAAGNAGNSTPKHSTAYNQSATDKMRESWESSKAAFTEMVRQLIPAAGIVLGFLALGWSGAPISPVGMYLSMCGAILCAVSIMSFRTLARMTTAAVGFGINIGALIYYAYQTNQAFEILSN